MNDLEMTPIELYNEMISNGKTPCFDMGNDGVVYFNIVCHEKNMYSFQYGTVSNTGFMHPELMEYDSYFSFDENLQGLYEVISGN